MVFYGLYKITNLVNGKIYIGQHVTDSLDDGYFGSGVYLKHALKKYGRQNFRKEWVMFCEDQDELNYMERVFVDDTFLLRSDTYNLMIGGIKVPRSSETNARISAALKGRHLSAECRAKLSASRKAAWADPEKRAKYLAENPILQKGYQVGEKAPMFEKHLSEKARRKLSEAHRGKPLSEEHRLKIGEAERGEKHWNFGKHVSAECRAKLSASRKAAWADPEKRATMLAANTWIKGGRHSEETKKKMSEARSGEKNPNFGRHWSEDIRRKIADANRGYRWWTNGTKCVRARECPGEGFVKGRTKNI